MFSFFSKNMPKKINMSLLVSSAAFGFQIYQANQFHTSHERLANELREIKRKIEKYYN